MTHDERRARAIAEAIYSEYMPFEPKDWPRTWPFMEAAARAIRESDEAAGMVLVPKSAMSLIESMIALPVSAFSVAALDGMFGLIRDQIAAATEADNDAG